jgi:hypothetical protein
LVSTASWPAAGTQSGSDPAAGAGVGAKVGSGVGDGVGGGVGAGVGAAVGAGVGEAVGDVVGGVGEVGGAGGVGPAEGAGVAESPEPPPQAASQWLVATVKKAALNARRRGSSTRDAVPGRDASRAAFSSWFMRAFSCGASY